MAAQPSDRTQEQRRLAAILAADVVGYSRLMEADEDGTLARLRHLFRTVVQPAVSARRGRIFKLMGDAFLAEFPAGVDAVLCAAALHQAVEDAAAGEPPAARIRLRIGLHVGDVIAEGGDLLGDGVNLAARLEGLAEPGGIVVSAAVAEAVRGRLPFALEDLGEQPLKNIARPVRAFRVGAAASAASSTAAAPPPLALPDKPSLVVLPFQNMSGDAEQDYFVDGLVEDITTALSCIRSLFVIARNSAFTYKGRAVDVRQVGRELGVRYVLEGSVRRAGGRIRVTGQLIEAASGAHLWADRFDGALDDVFDLQDRVTSAVAGAIEPRLQRAEIERAQRKPTQDLDAHDWYLRGLAALQEGADDLDARARALFAEACARDPGYGAAYGMAALCIHRRRTALLLPYDTPEIAEGIRLAQLAAERGRDDPTALWSASCATAYLAGDPRGGLLLAERALALNPNAAAAWNYAGAAENLLGNAETAIGHFERAMRLSPQDALHHIFLFNTAMAMLQARRYEEALVWAGRGISERPSFLNGRRIWIMALALAGRIEEARAAVAALLRDSPNQRLSRMSGLFFPREFRQRMHEAYRLAGVPE